MNLNKIKGYIFDLDGTLLDSMTQWMEIYESLFTEHNKTMPKGYLHEVNHLSMADASEYTAKNTNVGLTAPEILKFWQDKASEKYANEVPLKPYAYELLTILKQKGKKLGIATASQKQVITPCLVRHHIYELFDSMTSVDEVERGKNFPDIYLKECANLGLNPNECAVVEDSYVGALSAKNGGCLSIGVYDIQSKAQNATLRQNCNLYINDLDELIKML